MRNVPGLMLVGVLAAGWAAGHRVLAGPQPAPKATERVVLTERAAAKVLAFMKETPAAMYLRVEVADDRMKLYLDPNTDPAKDLRCESRGVTVVVEKASAAQLPSGVVVDYIERP